MNQWSPDQLLHAAETAAESGRLQDALTVLIYLVQSYPGSAEAERARQTYRRLSGSDCPEADSPAEAAADERAADGDAQAVAAVDGEPQEPATTPARVNGAGYSGHAAGGMHGGAGADAGLARGVRAAGPEQAASGETIAAASGPAAGVRPSADAREWAATPVVAPSGHLAEIDAEFSLELDERFGRVLAHVFFGLGFLLLPVGLLMLVFALAFGNLFRWAMVALIVALPLIGLGQLLRIACELRANLAELLKRGSHGQN
jgi:hypothetical protein